LKPLKLHNIFLYKFITLFTIFFIIFGIILYFWTKDIYIEQTKNHLLNNINIIHLQINNLDNLDNLAKKIKQQTKLRVTFIDKNGIVLGESHSNFNNMDNHINRDEIVKSNYSDYGSSIRYSQTIHKQFLYISRKFTINKNQFYIRVSKEITQIKNEFLNISYKIAFLFFVFIVITFLLSLKISKNVQIQTNNILLFLENLSKENKIIKINSSYSFEFHQITKILNILSEKLIKKNKQKLKYTAKLKLINRQKDDIISAISHEFKNPISVISGYAQTLIKDKNIDNKTKEKFLEKISSNSDKLTNMIDRLKLTIKLDEKKQIQTFKYCNITDLTKEIIQDLQLVYNARQINLKASNIKIKADKTLIGIAITNLIENALKYSKEDIEIEITDKFLCVMDNGIGIKQNEIPKITSKFYRSLKNKWDNSLGLGLFLVDNILKLHNFKLNIKSYENKGSTFSIIF
jgi:signal transduction histidine kinase